MAVFADIVCHKFFTGSLREQNDASGNFSVKEELNDMKQ